MIYGKIYREWALIVLMGLVLAFLAMKAKGLNHSSFYEESGVGYMIKGSVGNVRSGPSKDYEVVGQVRSGIAINPMGEGSGSWAKVGTENGPRGYMYRGILKEVLINGYKKRFGSEDYWVGLTRF